MFRGSSVSINLTFSDADSRRKVLVVPWAHAVKKDSKEPEAQYVFKDKDPITGEVVIATDEVITYTDIVLEFIGQITTINPDTRQVVVFSRTPWLLKKSDKKPHTIECVEVMTYSFPDLSKPYESYNGLTTQLRYFLRVTMRRQNAFDIVEEQDIWVQNPQAAPTAVVPGIKMEVGLEKCLHIEFEYNKRSYHLQDVILGKIFFLFVKIRVKYMELSLIRRETTDKMSKGSYHDSDTLAKFEVMDGNPVSGETIPVRIFLAPFRLTPTYKHVSNHFSVRYYVNLVLVDEEDRFVWHF
ncbi:Vacuolar protein sorting-associated protein 26 [Diplonema papillatum]|nr:Vacuolar protein sorting-associated protein 26 [Diplonema papillatum]